MSTIVPETFSALVTGRDPEPAISGDEWLAHLPRLVEASLSEWDLTLDGDPMHGSTALVLPVRLRDGSTSVLKVTWPHSDAEHEHLALQRLGHGAVRLIAANPVAGPASAPRARARTHRLRQRHLLAPVPQRCWWLWPPGSQASASFAVLGLTDGGSFSANPCLAGQVASVKASPLWVGEYAISTYPTSAQLTR